MSNSLPKGFVFSIALEGYEKTFSACIESQREYCLKHNYQFVLINTSPRKMKPKEAAWIKIPLILASLETGYDWVAFIDSDCEIRENTPPFDEYFTEYTGKSIFMATGKSGRLNSGVIFIKNEPAAISYFKTILANADYTVPSEDRTSFENGHIIHYGKGNNDIYTLDHTIWNNNSLLDDTSYIQHYSSGILRDWFYTKHNIQPKSKSAITKFLEKITRNTPEKRDKGYYTGHLSLELDKLMDFYYENYKGFKKGGY